jgi:hypothetical protein
MRIICTLGYILNNCNDWLAFCNEFGYDEYCCRYSGYGDEIKVELTKEEAIKYGLI